jgi:peptide deformylase
MQKTLSLIILSTFLAGCAAEQNNLPAYVDIYKTQDPRIGVLTKKARTLSFPLSSEDLAMIQALEAKFDQEENCAGLAAPQIGYDIRAIVFAVPDDEERPDLTQTMPKTVWLNPSYTPIGHEKHTDYEACFSVEGMAGAVDRYKKIHYNAYLIDGSKVEGIAEGFLARLIQHEIDHTNGILYKDKVKKGEFLPVEAYREKRSKAMKNGCQE